MVFHKKGSPFFVYFVKMGPLFSFIFHLNYDEFIQNFYQL